MEYIQLNNSTLKVSKICVGCMSFGKVTDNSWHTWTLDEKQTEEMVKKAIELGINFFDTANTYGNGTSEEFLGKALKNLNIKRENVIIATKVYFNKGCLSKEAIFREIDLSLKRLQTTYIDLYIIHRWDYNTPIEETMSALNELIKIGKVKYIGASAMYSYQLFKANECARQHNWATFITMQNHYNLLYREDEREMIQLIQEENMLLTPYSPLAAGRLCRLWEDKDSKRFIEDNYAKFKYDKNKDIDLPICRRVNELAIKYNVTMAQIALSWELSKNYVASAIVGCTKINQLEDAVKAISVKLNENDIHYLEELYLPHNVCGANTKEQADELYKNLLKK